MWVSLTYKPYNKLLSEKVNTRSVRGGHELFAICNKMAVTGAR